MTSWRATVTVTADVVAIPVPGTETVCDAILRGTFRYPYTCRWRRCATSSVQLLSGQVVYAKAVPRQVFSSEERAARVCLSCAAVPVGNIDLRVFG